MRISESIATAFLSLAALANAAKLTVSIPASPPLLPNPATLPPSTHATLLGAAGQHYDARLTRSNTLVFNNLPVGSYLLDIHTRDHFFPSFRVDVSVQDSGVAGKSTAEELVQIWQTFKGNEWSNLGPKFGEEKNELAVTLQPSGHKEYYQRREGFNIMNFFKSPMILMGLFSVVMIFGMPYLMDNMDPETKAEFQEMQKKSPLTGSEGAANQIQNFDLASWMAGKSTGDSSGTSTPSGGNAKARR